MPITRAQARREATPMKAARPKKSLTQSRPFEPEQTPKRVLTDENADPENNLNDSNIMLTPPPQAQPHPEPSKAKPKLMMRPPPSSTEETIQPSPQQIISSVMRTHAHRSPAATLEAAAAASSRVLQAIDDLDKPQPKVTFRPVMAEKQPISKPSGLTTEESSSRMFKIWLAMILLVAFMVLVMNFQAEVHLFKQEALRFASDAFTKMGSNLEQVWQATSTWVISSWTTMTTQMHAWFDRAATVARNGWDEL